MSADNIPGEIYLVGGAVRDELLGRPVKEKDWVVVGGDPDAMQAAGFKMVGADFPVFLHPETGEEYALARTERKTGGGHRAFATDTRGVSLADDLKRRDLTVNAIAKDAGGQLTDPFDGRSDLKKRTLRHVSPAFTEDPLRVLRAARFRAQLGEFDFHIAEETRQLMKRMVADDELSRLTKERVWMEVQKACRSSKPSRFFETLTDLKAWPTLAPDHPFEPFFQNENLEPLNRAAPSSLRVITTLAAQMAQHDIPLTPWLQQLNAPTRYCKPAKATREILPALKDRLNQAGRPSPEDTLNILRTTDARRNTEQLNELCAAWSLVQINGLSPAQRDTFLDHLRAAQKLLANLNAAEITAGLSGVDAGAAMRQAQIKALKQRAAE